MSLDPQKRRTTQVVRQAEICAAYHTIRICCNSANTVKFGLSQPFAPYIDKTNITLAIINYSYHFIYSIVIAKWPIQQGLLRKTLAVSTLLGFLCNEVPYESFAVRLK